MADPGLDGHPGTPARRGGAQKRGGAEAEALGRSRGGFSTKIHGGVSGLGLPVTLVLTPGQAADVKQAATLLDGVPFEVVIADKGYDSQPLVDSIEARGGEAVIPSQKNRARPRDYDRERYKDRNLAERFWNGSSSTGGWPRGMRRRPGTSWRSCMWRPSRCCCSSLGRPGHPASVHTT